VGPGDIVHYVYSRAGQVPGDLGDIYYTRSTDNGASWSSPVPLNSDQLDQNNVVQWQPSISVTSQGYVLAAWYDRRDTTDGLNYQYYGRMSIDNGATFLPEERIADLNIPQPVQVDPSTSFCFAGDSNFHAPLGNVSLATWTDGRNAVSDGAANVQQMDVYFDRVSLCPAIAVSPAVLPNGQLTVAYNQTVTAAGGTGPYTFALAGALPDGLGLDTGIGGITGTPTATGITPLAVIATDALGCAGSQDYSLIVDPAPASCPAISIAPATLPNTTQGAPYSATVTASGGTGPYAYAVTAGALPDGVTLNPGTGEIAGTAVESGSPTFAITATDANHCTGTRAYSSTVACPTITLSPDRQLPDAYVGVPYLTNITANGGTAPYTYKIVQGQIHAGLFTTSGGTVYGVTEGPGSKIFTMKATDVNGCTGEAQFRTDSVTCFPGDILCDAMGDLAANFTATDLCGGGAEWYGTAACPSSDDVGHSPSAHARWGTNLACNDYGSGTTQDCLTSTSLNVSNCNSGEVILKFNYLLSFEDDNSKDRARVEVVADGGAPVVVADNGAGGPTCSGLPSPGSGTSRSGRAGSTWRSCTRPRARSRSASSARPTTGAATPGGGSSSTTFSCAASAPTTWR
jgi:Putative Ig domain